MLPIDLTGKRAFVAGVAEHGGYGFAAARALAEAGATICVGTWPPALTIFQNLLERGKLAESMRLAPGRTLAFERVYPLAPPPAPAARRLRPPGGRARRASRKQAVQGPGRFLHRGCGGAAPRRLRARRRRRRGAQPRQQIG